MCGSDEPHSYPVRSFSYRKKQVRANEVQRVSEYSMSYQLQCVEKTGSWCENTGVFFQKLIATYLT